MGCPDTDNDGIQDTEDNCPEEAGPEENQGCPWPDSDNDGVLDKDDNCPQEAGPEENSGCPWPDRDQDGIPDKDDDCPDEAANTASGCPIVESTIIDALNRAGINILFPADGSNLIGSKVLEAVAQVKTILDENPHGIVLIQGHASEDGSELYNQALSK